MKKATNPQNLTPRGPGRQKGSKNKLSGTVKDRLLQVWANLEANGQGLDTEAQKDPKWYYEIFVRPMIPKNIDMLHGLSDPTIELVRQVLIDAKTPQK